MFWLSLLSGLVKLTVAVLRFVERKDLIDAGMAKAALASLTATGKTVDDAIAAARAVRDDPDSSYVRKLRDKYTRGK